MSNAVLNRETNVPTPLSETRLWGMSPLAVHDAYWKSLGVAVVRPNTDVSDDANAGMFLLLGSGAACIVDFAKVLEKMGWLQPRLCVVRPFVPPNEKAEKVSLSRCGWTTDRSIAKEWSMPGGWRRLKAAAGNMDFSVVRARGRIFETRVDGAMTRMLDRLARVWSDPTEGIPGLEKLSHGVFGMDKSQAGKTSVGKRLWLGRGRTLDEVRGSIAEVVLVDAGDSF